MQKILEEKNREIDQLKQKVYRLQQSTRQKRETAQQGLQPQHSVPHTHTTEGELCNVHVAQRQQSEEEVRLRDKVRQLTAQLEEAQRNVVKGKEDIWRVKRELVKAKDSLKVARVS